MSQKIKIARQRKHGFPVSAEVYLDKRLNWGCKGLMSYILSLDDGAEFSFQNVEDMSGSTEESVREMLETLKVCGYIKFTRELEGDVEISATLRIVKADDNPTAPEPMVERIKGFDIFWKAYPSCERKKGKKACLEKWQTKKCAGFVEKVLGKLEEDKKCSQWLNPEYIPAPLVWLNKERWEDEE